MARPVPRRRTGIAATLAAAALLVGGSAHAGEATPWRAPGGEAGLSGGIHSVYAELYGSGTAEAFGQLSVRKDGDLGNGTGAHRVGFGAGAGLALIDRLELAVLVAGSAVGTDDDQNYRSFGDVHLRGKYVHRLNNPARVALWAGYDIFQGVADRSTVAEVASPSVGLALSYFGDLRPEPSMFRGHLNLSYHYDRTVNFFGDRAGSPTPTQRLAWGMRDDTYLRARAAVEAATEWVLPTLAYGVELPLGDGVSGEAVVHTITPGLKARILDRLLVSLALDVFVGDRDGRGPPLPPVEGLLALSYRIGADYRTAAPTRPVEPAAIPEPPVRPATDPATAPAPATGGTPATTSVPATSPAPGTAPTPATATIPATQPATAPSAAPPAVAPATAPAEPTAPAAAAATSPAAPATTPVDTAGEPDSAPEAGAAEEPAGESSSPGAEPVPATEPTPESDREPKPEPEDDDTAQEQPSGPVNLEQFAD